MQTAEVPPATILVVDDTIENLQLLANLLGGHGYDVRPVTNGRLALQAVEREAPDLILLDISMPAMDGYEVCARLKQIDVARDVPVIFLTAMTDTADKVKAFAAGGVDYITKPFQIDEVLARVATHIALRRAQRSLAEEHARLLVLEDLRDKLFHMVVHDMRSPLMALSMNLEFLQGEIEHVASDQAKTDLRTSIRAAQGLGGMANQLLDITRLEEGQMPLTRETTNLVEVAREVVTRLGGLDRSLSIDVDASAVVSIDCDAAVVRRVIENLLSNAIAYSPPGGRIRLTVSRVADRARVAVHDEGPGVPEEARQRIFEKFGTVETGEKRTRHSVGLGLAFCKLAIEAHGGAIGVMAGRPAGSVFWFEIPV